MERTLLVLIGMLFIVHAAVWADTPALIITEVAWMGSEDAASDEWIELYNASEEDLTLNGWRLVWGTNEILLRVHIPAQSYFLLERGDDNAVANIAADEIYRGSLDNRGQAIFLYDAEGNLVDSANGDGGPWPAGNNRSKSTMQRQVFEFPEQDGYWVTAPATPKGDNYWLRPTRTGLFSSISDMNLIFLAVTTVVIAATAIWWFNR